MHGGENVSLDFLSSECSTKDKERQTAGVVVGVALFGVDVRLFFDPGASVGVGIDVGVSVGVGTGVLTAVTTHVTSTCA